ncbi:Alpha/Beta hydrolase protein [Aspergillus karnatakaensis]|uniref:putative alpha/beta hydrolase n=1 Tax=Aspergillus karnatakaensis TaxID=1810916 RepID=UPI003CCD95CD
MSITRNTFRRLYSTVRICPSDHASQSPRVDLAFDLHTTPAPRGSAACSTPKSTEKAPILFLHGFLGSKRENKISSRKLAQELGRPVYALDLRNHGDSGHHPQHDYMEMALDVKAFIERHKIKRSSVIGHSMGAKTALTLALHSPDSISSVVAVDNCPISLPLEPEFERYLDALARLRDERLASHREADKFLSQYEESPAIRLWLISNLVKAPGSPFLTLRIPVETLKRAIGPLGDFPYKEDLGKKNFLGRTLFLRARESRYITSEALPIIREFFPRSSVVDVDSGHWIVQEREALFREIVTKFLPEAEE